MENEVEVLKVARHDFKTPLTTLRMIAQMFQLSIEKGAISNDLDRTARNCRMMVEQVDKLVTLADTFSDIALLVSGKLKLDKHHADLRAIIETLVAQIGETVTITRMPEEPVWGSWDTARLQRALCYVCLHAPKVEISLEQEDKQITIHLKGDFKKPSGHFSDAGLYFAQAIIEQHGGEMKGEYEITFRVIV